MNVCSRSKTKLSIHSVAYLILNKVGVRHHRGSRWCGAVEVAGPPSQKKNHFCPQNDKFRCILTQFLTGIKHEQSLEALDTDFAVQSRNKVYKSSAKIIKKSTVRPKRGCTIAPPPHCVHSCNVTLIDI